MLQEKEEGSDWYETGYSPWLIKITSHLEARYL
jgi:hypothetical protein